MIEIRCVENIIAFVVLEFLHFFFYSVYFLYYAFYIKRRQFLLLILMLVFIVVDIILKKLIHFICAGLFISFWFAAFILTDVIFLHFFNQLLVLSFCHFFTADAHVSVDGSYSPH